MKYFLTTFSWVKKFKFPDICWENNRQQYFVREGKESKQKGNSSGSGSSLQGGLGINSYSAPALVLKWCNKLFQTH